MRRGLLAFHEALLEGAATLVAALYGLVALLMTVDIGLRACRLGSLPWLLEATEYVLYGGTFLAAPWVLRKGAHVRVDLLLMSVPRSVAVALEITADAIGFAVSAVLLWFGSVAVIEAWREKAMQFKTWAVPEWTLLVLIPIGALLLIVEFALRVARVRGVVSEEIDPTSRAGI